MQDYLAVRLSLNCPSLHKTIKNALSCIYAIAKFYAIVVGLTTSYNSYNK